MLPARCATAGWDRLAIWLQETVLNPCIQVSIPKGIQVPEDATHLAVATENEAGHVHHLQKGWKNGKALSMM